MRHRPLLRLLGCALLALALTPSFVAPAFGAEAARRGSRPAAPATSWLNGLWKAIGCLVLPGATCTLTGGAQPTSDYGCSVDPNGTPHCNPTGLTQPGGEYGCSVDPDGVRRCDGSNVLQPTFEYGCGADPNGLCR
jgi:hypothetical protein